MVLILTIQQQTLRIRVHRFRRLTLAPALVTARRTYDTVNIAGGMVDIQYRSHAMYYRRAPQQLNSMLGFVLNQKGGHHETLLIGFMHYASH